MSTLQEVLSQVAGEAVEAPVNFDDLPEQFGARVDPLQPGSYRFKLPTDLTQIWKPLLDLDINYRDAAGNEQTRKGKRVMAVFEGNSPLLIVQSPDGTRNGEAFRWSTSNVERWRDRDHTQKACDLDYLLRALGVTTHPGFGNNQGYMEALMQHGAGKEFGAEATISWYCNPKRPIYAEFDDGQGGRTVQEVPHVMGNGQRYTTREVQRDANGNYPVSIPVSIQATDPATGQPVVYTAIVRGFNDLTSLRA